MVKHNYDVVIYSDILKHPFHLKYNRHSNIQKCIVNDGSHEFIILITSCTSPFLLVNAEATAGVEFGSIKDDQMKSSNHPHHNDPYPAHYGRLNGPRAWCGSLSRRKLYLQIDFLWNFEGTSIQMKGFSI